MFGVHARALLAGLLLAGCGVEQASTPASDAPAAVAEATAPVRTTDKATTSSAPVDPNGSTPVADPESPAGHSTTTSAPAVQPRLSRGDRGPSVNSVKLHGAE